MCNFFLLEIDRNFNNVFYYLLCIFFNVSQSDMSRRRGEKQLRILLYEWLVVLLLPSLQLVYSEANVGKSLMEFLPIIIISDGSECVNAYIYPHYRAPLLPPPPLAALQHIPLGSLYPEAALTHLFRALVLPPHV